MNNTIQRTISGIGFIIIMVAGLLINKFLYATLISLILFFTMKEFYNMTMGNQHKLSRFLSILSGETLFLCLFCICAYNLPFNLVYFSLLPLLMLMISALRLNNRDSFERYSHFFTGIVYIAIPLALSNLIVFSNNQYNGMLLLALFIIIWASDVGAFIFGITLGQRFGKKLCPTISPKKSWIGFWGGLLSSIIAALILNYYNILTFNIIHSVILAMIIDITGVCGDLFESQWKRSFNIKDSGNIIPGHGGMLDRFDSSLFAIPAGIMYLVLFNLI